MAGENVDLVRRVFDGGPDVERLLRAGKELSGHPWMALFHPECVVEDMAEIPDGRTYVGREGVVQFAQRAYGDVWEEWRFVPREIIEGTDGVFAAVENSGRSKTGLEVQMEIFQVFRIRDGMIVHATGYLDRDKAVKAAGLEA
jgi:ketosteroid isomerase-like protein